MVDAKSSAGKTSHNVVLNNRKKIDMTGVLDVESFDEEYILVHTECGLMQIQGYELNIVKLDIDNRKLVVEGNIVGMVYDDKTEKTTNGFWSKLLG